MFRITMDPSSGKFIQYLAKTTVMVFFFVSFGMDMVGVMAAYLQICCHNTNYAHVNVHDRTIIVILAKHCIKLPDDGSIVIRNMLEHF